MKSHYGKLILKTIDASRLLNSDESSELATAIVGVLNEHHQIDNAMEGIYQASIELNAALKRIMEELEDQRRKIRASCNHLSTTTIGDPSGNGDNETRCDTCGDTLL